MYKPKTTETDATVSGYIESIDHPKKRQDAYKLVELFEQTSGYPPKMWGPSIIGFGSYHYVYKTGHEGDAPLVGFSPRKAKISLYFATGDEQRGLLLEKLGKHTSGKSCVYIHQTDDVDLEVLQQLIRQSIDFLQKLYPPKKL